MLDTASLVKALWQQRTVQWATDSGDTARGQQQHGHDGAPVGDVRGAQVELQDVGVVLHRLYDLGAVAAALVRAEEDAVTHDHGVLGGHGGGWTVRT